MCPLMLSSNFQEGVTDPPSISSISRLLRGNGRGGGGAGGRDDPEGKKDYTINGILGVANYKVSRTHSMGEIYNYKLEIADFDMNCWRLLILL
ncbi:unnamed protein product [Brassicogethes aeneus]|uniref:Uncharacterized protein n=1 Tax=Brassicogethes aeneus TaxID=1431903 RepID=A0A9P0FNK9_BRAAE|nr:unnamed protein product [Brassicogethes aeneus]